MMRELLFGGLLLVLAGTAGAAELDVSRCKMPEPPAVPDGQTASEAEMGEASTDVREYIVGVQSSLECLAQVEQSMGEEISEEQSGVLVTLYNAGVDQMEAVAENYNAQVREFKARQ
jgi:hypothetical protein